MRAGTPNELETKSYDSPAPAKNWLKKKIKDREKWAGRYNLALEERLRSIREEFDGIDFAKLPVGETRQWAVTDDVTKVQFVYKIKKVDA